MNYTFDKRRVGFYANGRLYSTRCDEFKKFLSYAAEAKQSRAIEVFCIES